MIFTSSVIAAFGVVADRDPSGRRGHIATQRIRSNHWRTHPTVLLAPITWAVNYFIVTSDLVS